MYIKLILYNYLSTV
ncbi:CPXV212 protein [Cowpox virus]|uniref:CPXV212 protein n=1 Tax=Cowpox virus TaxID=10243 RepID=U5TDS6_COWPX|nr:CPXV212 protein [Cowpox virus]